MNISRFDYCVWNGRNPYLMQSQPVAVKSRENITLQKLKITKNEGRERVEREQDRRNCCIGHLTTLLNMYLWRTWNFFTFHESWTWVFCASVWGNSVIAPSMFYMELSKASVATAWQVSSFVSSGCPGCCCLSLCPFLLSFISKDRLHKRIRSAFLRVKIYTETAQSEIGGAFPQNSNWLNLMHWGLNTRQHWACSSEQPLALNLLVPWTPYPTILVLFAFISSLLN